MFRFRTISCSFWGWSCWSRAGGRLVYVITAFTLAHSHHFGLGDAGPISPPHPPWWRRLSRFPSCIFGGRAFAAARSGSAHRLATKLSASHVAFGFGLLHGFGFAGMCSADIGLPRDLAAIWALALFNIGLEVGPLLIRCGNSLMLALGATARLLAPHWRGTKKGAPTAVQIVPQAPLIVLIGGDIGLLAASSG